MGFKLSQTTKDFFDVIRTVSSYISIATVGIGVILFTIDNNIVINFFKNHKSLAYCLGCFLVFLPLILPFIYKWINLLSLKNRKLSNIIIERQDIVIDITEGGKNASYYERLCFYKLAKNKRHYVTKLIVSGAIDPGHIYTSNCYYNLNDQKNKLTISYVNHTTGLNNYASLLKSSEKFLTYSAVILDSFTQDEETWDLYPTHYCIFFNLSIAMPQNKRILYAKLYKKLGDELIELEDIAPIVITENDRSKLLLQIVDYDYGDYLSLKWKLA